MIVLFKIILLALLFIFIVFGIMAFRVYRSFHNVAKQFKDLNKNRTNGYNGQQRRATSDDDVIIDSRNPDDANRKIFSDNEGEYVDFEEEK
ncbi:MAG: DUF4834 family protein [Prevotellaceae bacterium]|nr:DUF4834 family protein [Prevotellaceae bacterium]